MNRTRTSTRADAASPPRRMGFPRARVAVLALGTAAALLLPAAVVQTEASFTGSSAARGGVRAVTLSTPGTLQCTDRFVILSGDQATISWTGTPSENPNVRYEVTAEQNGNIDSYLVDSGTSTTFSPGLLGLGGLIDFLFTSGTATISVRQVTVLPDTDTVVWRSAPSTRTVRVSLPLLGLLGGFKCN